MKKNEYDSIEQFVAQYTGNWDPSRGHWLGLDFVYDGVEYRFHTGRMYDDEACAYDGKKIVFRLYRKKEAADETKREYELLAEFANIDNVLNSTVIQGIPFKDVIVDDDTELVGQD